MHRKNKTFPKELVNQSSFNFPYKIHVIGPSSSCHFISFMPRRKSHLNMSLIANGNFQINEFFSI